MPNFLKLCLLHHHGTKESKEPHKKKKKKKLSKSSKGKYQSKNSNSAAISYQICCMVSFNWKSQQKIES